jgi:hypothetical protein
MNLRHISEEEFDRMRKRVGRTGANREDRIRPVKNPVAAGASPYRSKWEAAMASRLDLEKRAGVIKDYQYEGLTLKLAKGQYHRPDFLVWHLDGSIELKQVKGWHKNLRAGIKGLKWAMQLNPWFKWTLASRVKGGGWREETL